MEISEILSLLSTVPTWAWMVGAIIIVFFAFGESILWDYEVKFPFKEGIGRGKVELECGKNKGTRIECVFEMNPSHKTSRLMFSWERQRSIPFQQKRTIQAGFTSRNVFSSINQEKEIWWSLRRMVK
jgi:hypothetical protein